LRFYLLVALAAGAGRYTATLLALSTRLGIQIIVWKLPDQITVRADMARACRPHASAVEEMHCSTGFERRWRGGLRTKPDNPLRCGCRHCLAGQKRPLLQLDEQTLTNLEA
jgi:hypothetical protein